MARLIQALYGVNSAEGLQRVRRADIGFIQVNSVNGLHRVGWLIQGLSGKQGFFRLKSAGVQLPSPTSRSSRSGHADTGAVVNTYLMSADSGLTVL